MSLYIVHPISVTLYQKTTTNQSFADDPTANDIILLSSATSFINEDLLLPSCLLVRGRPKAPNFEYFMRYNNWPPTRSRSRSLIWWCDPGLRSWGLLVSLASAILLARCFLLVTENRSVLPSYLIGSINLGLDALFEIQPAAKERRRLCSRDEIRQGAWRPVTLDAPPYIPRHSKCYSQAALQAAKKWTDYQWYPHNATTNATTNGLGNTDDDGCDFSQFSNAAFCRLASNKTIGLFGDSLSWEHFSALAGRFGKHVGAHDQIEFTSDDGKRYHQREGITLDIVCQQDNEDSEIGQQMLVPISTIANNDNDTNINSDNRMATTFRLSFMRARYPMYLDSFLELVHPDILVLNVGAHYSKDSDLLRGFSNRPNTTGVQWMLRELLKYQKDRQHQNRASHGHNFLTIWRTTTPGIHHCDNFTRPVQNLTQMEDHIAYTPEGYPGRTKSYNWYNFQRQNILVLKEFQQFQQEQEDPEQRLLNYDIMHGYDVATLRPDGKVGTDPARGTDCLHNCDPGTADVYNTLLLHLMRLQEAKENNATQQAEKNA